MSEPQLIAFESDDALARRIRAVAIQLDRVDLAGELLELARLLDPQGHEQHIAASLFEPGSDRP